MAMELDMIALTPQQRFACLNTVSANTFFMLVADALVSGKALSVVRMGDGEKRLYEYCKDHSDGFVTDEPFGEEWLRYMGCYEIPAKELALRLEIAAMECTYFAPQIMGIQRPEFWLGGILTTRTSYIDNWFVRQWSRDLQDKLLRKSRVLFLHASGEVREKVAARSNTVECWEMSVWQQADEIIERAKNNAAKLVLFSGGPANKYIGPKIATSGYFPKVVLDLGQAAQKEWV